MAKDQEKWDTSSKPQAASIPSSPYRPTSRPVKVTAAKKGGGAGPKILLVGVLVVAVAFVNQFLIRGTGDIGEKNVEVQSTPEEEVAVDAEHHLKVSIEVTQEANDHQSLDPIAQQAKQDLGLAADAPLTVLADSGYGNGTQLAACESHGTTALTPVQKSRGESNDLYKSEDFTHDPATDTYTCPAGRTLARRADRKCGGGFHTYSNSAACKACPAREQCTKGPFRKLLISVNAEVITRARERLAAEPEAMRQRAGIVAPPLRHHQRPAWTRRPALPGPGPGQSRNGHERLGLQLHPSDQPSVLSRKELCN